MRRIRLRAVWLLIIPFLWLARPTPTLLAVGGALGLLGLAVRAWAAGVIAKEERLTVEGPYAHTRNPLYVGSFFLGLGVTVAGGQWYFVALFLAFYLVIYGRTIGGEAALLEELFGERYRHYAEHVPLVLPRLTPYRPPDEAPEAPEAAEAPDVAEAPEAAEVPEAPDAADASFTLSRYRRNKEYEAVLGAVAGYGFLAAKMWWMS